MATTPGAMSLLDIQSRVLHLLIEPGPDTGTTPVPVAADFAATTLTRDINIALGMYLGLTGLAPALSDVLLTEPIVAGLDFALPANLASLQRVEYTPAGQFPYQLAGMSFTEFDEATGGVVPPATGWPEYFRQPFAGKIRLQPQPGPGNVSAGDTITLYYASLGTILVNPTDVPGIPAQFHMALVYGCLADYWLRKKEMDSAAVYERKFDRLVTLGKAYQFDSERASQPTIGGSDELENYGVGE